MGGARGGRVIGRPAARSPAGMSCPVRPRGALRRRRDKPQSHRFVHEFNDAAHTEASHNRGPVALDGFHAQVQGERDLFRTPSVSHHAEDFMLAKREEFVLAGRVTDASEISVDHGSRNARAEEAVTAIRRPDRDSEDVCARFIPAVAVATGVKGAEHVVRDACSRHHDRSYIGFVRRDATACRQGVSTCVSGTRESHVDRGGCQQLEGFAFIAGFACNTDVIVLPYCHADVAANGRVAVHDQDLDRLPPLESPRSQMRTLPLSAVRRFRSPRHRKKSLGNRGDAPRHPLEHNG